MSILRHGTVLLLSVTYSPFFQIIYPINNTNIGSGNEGNIVFPSHTTTTFDFPFTIDYQRALDPDNLILVDLATKCGILGNPSDISVNYKITVRDDNQDVLISSP